VTAKEGTKEQPMEGFEVSYIGALGAGILSFLSPCVLPLVPPYLCFIGGVSLEQMTDDSESLPPGVMRSVLLSSVVFVLGFTTVFVMLGATASTIGQFVADYLDLLSQIAGGIIIILGLHFMGVFRIPFLFREARFHS
jgi:cytochrome c-type biogenesis protein